MEAIRYAPRTFPARVADLGFAAQLPLEWVVHELPAEDADVGDPTVFVPLAVVTAPHAAIVLTFAGRPAYDDGTLLDWAHYLLQQHGLTPRAVGRGQVAGVAAVVGEATMASDVGTMVSRFAFLEDGGRLVHLSLLAPELLAEAVREVWFTALRTFALATPRGSRFALEGHPDEVPLPAAPPRPAPVEAAAPPPTASRAPKTTFADFALASDTASFDPEQAINRNLRDRGVGLVPNVRSYDDGDRFVIVAVGAIVAELRVPYGWHVIDDGRRVLVFEPAGKVQIHLDRIVRHGRNDDALLDEVEAAMRQAYPSPEFVRAVLGRVRALGARGIRDGDQAIEQYHLLLPAGGDEWVLRARVTTTPEQAIDANNLAELLLAHVAFFDLPPEPEVPANTTDDAPADAVVDDRASPQSASPPALPAWWQRAGQLEAAGHCAEAEALIRDAVQHIGCAASIAELYRQRMLRLQAAGDAAGADDAFRRARAAMFDYASMATSGGEGAALSLERDEFVAQLVVERGHDAAAR